MKSIIRILYFLGIFILISLSLATSITPRNIDKIAQISDQILKNANLPSFNKWDKVPTMSNKTLNTYVGDEDEDEDTETYYAGYSLVVGEDSYLAVGNVDSYRGSETGKWYVVEFSESSINPFPLHQLGCTFRWVDGKDVYGNNFILDVSREEPFTMSVFILAIDEATINNGEALLVCKFKTIHNFFTKITILSTHVGGNVEEMVVKTGEAKKIQLTQEFSDVATLSQMLVSPRNTILPIWMNEMVNLNSLSNSSSHSGSPASNLIHNLATIPPLLSTSSALSTSTTSPASDLPKYEPFFYKGPSSDTRFEQFSKSFSTNIFSTTLPDVFSRKDRDLLIKFTDINAEGKDGFYFAFPNAYAILHESIVNNEIDCKINVQHTKDASLTAIPISATFVSLHSFDSKYFYSPKFIFKPSETDPIQLLPKSTVEVVCKNVSIFGQRNLSNDIAEVTQKAVFIVSTILKDDITIENAGTFYCVTMYCTYDNTLFGSILPLIIGLIVFIALIAIIVTIIYCCCRRCCGCGKNASHDSTYIANFDASHTKQQQHADYPLTTSTSSPYNYYVSPNTTTGSNMPANANNQNQQSYTLLHPTGDRSDN